MTLFRLSAILLAVCMLFTGCDAVRSMLGKPTSKDLEQLRLTTLLKDEFDQNDCILALHAGAGGTEAQDWTQMLYRMYTRWAERHGYNTPCWTGRTETRPASSPPPSKSRARTPTAT